MSPRRGCRGGVLHGDLQALHGRAESLARGTAEEECGDVGVEGEVQDEDLFVGLGARSLAGGLEGHESLADAASVVAEAHGVRGGHGRGRGEGGAGKDAPEEGSCFRREGPTGADAKALEGVKREVARGLRGRGARKVKVEGERGRVPRARRLWFGTKRRGSAKVGTLNKRDSWRITELFSVGHPADHSRTVLGMRAWSDARTPRVATRAAFLSPAFATVAQALGASRARLDPRPGPRYPSTLVLAIPELATGTMPTARDGRDPQAVASWLRRHGKAKRAYISRDERADLAACFTMLDEDGSGAIDARGLLEAFLLLGIPATLEQCRRRCPRWTATRAVRWSSPSSSSS